MKLENNGKKYQVVYADPPWRYRFGFKDRAIEKHYNTLPLDKIKELKIPIENNCVLFLWATAPKLKDAMEVMGAWGFEYKTCAIWDKKIIGMGLWFRGQHELLLVGTKGKFSPPAESERISSVLREKRKEHSKKPDFVRYLIEKWFPDKNKIELFARNRVEGWDCFGNELSDTIQRRLS